MAALQTLATASVFEDRGLQILAIVSEFEDRVCTSVQLLASLKIGVQILAAVR